MLRVGDATGGRSVVPTNQVVSPLGEQIVVPTRVNALAISPDGRWLAGLGSDHVVMIDLDAKRVADSAAQCGSVTGIVFSPNGQQLFASDSLGSIEVYAVDITGQLKKSKPIRPAPGGRKVASGNTAPAGLAVDPGRKTIWAALNMANTVAEIDMSSGRVLRKIAVGNGPYDVLCTGGKVYVSNWGGRRPGPGNVTGPSGLAPAVRVDRQWNIASEGSVSVIDPAQGRTIKEIVVGPHSSGLAVSPDGRFVCVANANADTVSVIEVARDEVVETISTRPVADLLLGSPERPGVRSGRAYNLRLQRHEQRYCGDRVRSREEPAGRLPSRRLVSRGAGIRRASAHALRGQHQGQRCADCGGKSRS